MVAELPDAFYRDPVATMGQSPGAQLRHVLDFFERLFEGLASRRVDYDLRRREAMVELDVNYALRRLELTRERLARLAEQADGPLAVRMDEVDLPADQGFTASSLGRELRFLATHTLHHLAILALLLRERGVAVDPRIGVAPSTETHRDGHEPA